LNTGIGSIIKNIRLNVIGISSTIKPEQGQSGGFFAESHRNFVREKWGKPPIQGEIRLFLLHHNMQPTLSYSELDEKDCLVNAGNALLTLGEHNCNIVIGGHTHVGSVRELHDVIIDSHGYRLVNNKFISISTGTTGGFHPDMDRLRSFNILEISAIDQHKNSRSIRLIPFFYNSNTQR